MQKDSTPRPEEWRAIADFPGYDVSSQGRVRSWIKRVFLGFPLGCRAIIGDSPVILKLATTTNGYKFLHLRRDGKSINRYVHHLVLEAFVGPCPPGMECRHFPDRNKSNNRIENISWGSKKANSADRLVHGTDCRGEKCGIAKLSDVDVLEIRNRVANGEKLRDVAPIYGVTFATIGHISKRRTWKHI